jgi:hypothetical protein
MLYFTDQTGLRCITTSPVFSFLVSLIKTITAMPLSAFPDISYLADTVSG